MSTPQILGGQLGSTPHTTNTNYAPFLYGRSASFGSDYVYLSNVIPTAGTLSKLYITLSGAPGEGKSYTFTVMKNSVASDLAVTISGTDTTGEDSAHSVSCSPGDLIMLRSVPSGTPAGSLTVRTSIIWEPTVDGEYIFGGDSANSLVGNNYIALAANNSGSSETSYTAVVPLEGTIKKLVYQHQAAPGAGKSVICTTRKNGSDQSLVATVTGAATQAIDTTNSFSVSPGDLICAVLSVAGGAISYRATWAFVYFPSDTSKIPMVGSSTATLATTITQYGFPQFAQVIQTSGTAAYIFCRDGFNFLGIRVALLTAPGEGKSRTFTLRDDNSDTDLTLTISGSDTTGSASATVSPADLSLLNFMSVSNNTPAASILKIGFIYEASTGATSSPPTTIGGTTSAPTTLAPSTAPPTTLEATTPAPSTSAPTTGAPTTLAPTTLVVTTEGPTTSPPTTVVVTTLAPTTIAPTTLAPTTLAPALANLVGGKLVNQSILFGRLVQ